MQSSVHKGVWWDKEKVKWSASIKGADGKTRRIGRYDDELKAAEAVTLANFWQNHGPAMG